MAKLTNNIQLMEAKVFYTRKYIHTQICIYMQTAINLRKGGEEERKLKVNYCQCTYIHIYRMKGKLIADWS